ncbi:MAG: MauE/DoxX family redox-associated membrane protein [Rothia sp. (in: high G+C Gram-positive bacteria)]|nr:MauE/DoxX family redox-associated membrane protein [Rothia sp. (in: high G+C Gram-positive bacteria)]
MTPLVLCTLTIIVTLAVSGYAKAKEPASTVTAIVNLKLDQWLPVKLVARTLPWAELALAAVLFFAPGLIQVLAAVAAVLLFIGYWVFIARAVVQGNTASCNCFGSASTAPISVYTLVRNTALLLAACGALIGALNTGGSAFTMLLALDAHGWLWVIGAGLASLTLWAIYRSELVPVSGTEGAPSALEFPVDEQGEYVRTPIPYAALHYPVTNPSQEPGTGQATTLRELAAQQARVLIWVSPGCGHCHEVIAKIDEWQQQLPMLGVHPVVSTDSNIQHFTFTTDVQCFVDPGFKTQALFGSGTPGSLALGADGLLAGGPVFGGNKVISFIEDIITEVNADYYNHVEADAEAVDDGEYETIVIERQ